MPATRTPRASLTVSGDQEVPNQELEQQPHHTQRLDPLDLDPERREFLRRRLMARIRARNNAHRQDSPTSPPPSRNNSPVRSTSRSRSRRLSNPSPARHVPVPQVPLPTASAPPPQPDYLSNGRNYPYLHGSDVQWLDFDEYVHHWSREAAAFRTLGGRLQRTFHIESRFRQENPISPLESRRERILRHRAEDRRLAATIDELYHILFVFCLGLLAVHQRCRNAERISGPDQRSNARWGTFVDLVSVGTRAARNCHDAFRSRRPAHSNYHRTQRGGQHPQPIPDSLRVSYPEDPRVSIFAGHHLWPDNMENRERMDLFTQGASSERVRLLAACPPSVNPLPNPWLRPNSFASWGVHPTTSDAAIQTHSGQSLGACRDYPPHSSVGQFSDISSSDSELPELVSSNPHLEPTPSRHTSSPMNLPYSPQPRPNDRRTFLRSTRPPRPHSVGPYPNATFHHHPSSFPTFSSDWDAVISRFFALRLVVVNNEPFPRVSRFPSDRRARLELALLARSIAQQLEDPTLRR